MATVDETTYPDRTRFPWGSIIAGALTASALIFVLLTFGSALGLSMASTSPTWRDGSFALALLSGVFLILAAAVSFGTGGYVTGRLASHLRSGSGDRDFREGANGLIVWALALALSSLLTAAVSSPLSRALPASNQQSSSAGDAIIAYDLDRLFRSDRPQPDIANARGEASRIAYAAAGRTGIAQDDRAYLARMTAARTGISAGEAERRVDDFTARATTAINRARRIGVLVGFMTAAALLVGAAAAWFAAIQGARGQAGAWNFGRRFAAPRHAFAGLTRTSGGQPLSSHPLIGSDRVDGTVVYGANRQRLGTVERIMIDKRSGRVAYAVMSTGGVMGIGGDEHHIPWSKLTYDTDLGGYRTDITGDQLRSAPAFSRDPNTDWTDREREQALHDHWRATYYWENRQEVPDGERPT